MSSFVKTEVIGEFVDKQLDNVVSTGAMVSASPVTILLHLADWAIVFILVTLGLVVRYVIQLLFMDYKRLRIERREREVAAKLRRMKHRCTDCLARRDRQGLTKLRA